MMKFEATTDQNLVAELIKGKVVAFDNLYERYSERLYVFALMLLKDKEDSRDVVQETFLKLWQKRNELNESKSFKSFVFTISYNIIIDRFRKRTNDQKFMACYRQHFNFETSSAVNDSDFNLINQQVIDIIEKLPLRRKEIFKLSREKGLTYSEIANELNISVKTVETQIGLALKYIRAEIDDKNLMIILFVTLFC
jgi:RNA polymerase sigma-70 factor (ECF subfamily)